MNIKTGIENIGLRQFVEINESLNELNVPELTDEQLNSIESYFFDVDDETCEIVTTLYDADGQVVLTYKVDDFDVAVGYLQAIGFDLDNLEQFDYDNDSDADDPLDHDEDGVDLI